jgi:hypothetical protein
LKKKLVVDNDVQINSRLTDGSSSMSVGLIATLSALSVAKDSAIEEANNYTDENLNNYYTKSASYNVYAPGPYEFVKILDNSKLSDIAIEGESGYSSSTTCTVTSKSTLWKNKQDGTYKIIADFSSTDASCSLTANPLKVGSIATIGYKWRYPKVYFSRCCPNAASQLTAWYNGGSGPKWGSSNLTGQCLLTPSNGASVLNGNGLIIPSVIYTGSNGPVIGTLITELDTANSSALATIGFNYHIEMLTSATKLLQIATSNITDAYVGTYTSGATTYYYFSQFSIYNPNPVAVTCTYKLSGASILSSSGSITTLTAINKTITIAANSSATIYPSTYGYTAYKGFASTSRYGITMSTSFAANGETTSTVNRNSY